MFGFRKATTDNTADTAQDDKKPGLFNRLKQGLSRTRNQLSTGVADLVLGKKIIDDALLEELEDILLSADLGLETTQHVLKNITAQVSRKQLNDGAALLQALQNELSQLLQPCEKPLSLEHQPTAILMVGINGAGKTTTIGKLAKQFKQNGKSVILAAGDTFRAAAVEQLQVWGERNEIPVIAQHTGADSASVTYDALQAAQARQADVVIADTAGRLHTQANLMEELKKVKRVMSKLDEAAPHEIILVLDASIGQNALRQAEEFQQALGLTGLVITKLDGTAKGGVIFAIANRLQLPIYYIGVGEGIDDLRPFNADDFVNALFAETDS